MQAVARSDAKGKSTELEVIGFDGFPFPAPSHILVVVLDNLIMCRHLAHSNDMWTGSEACAMVTYEVVVISNPTVHTCW